MINYIKGDLFKLAPKGAYLAHACNAQGIWGAGIAKTFKDKYPEDYEEYKSFCRNMAGNHAVGRATITKNSILCLITSGGFAKNVSRGDIILCNTKESLDYLYYILPKDAVVYSNKFNSGLFNVPWEHTEYFLKFFLERRPDVKWTVVEWTE